MDGRVDELLFFDVLFFFKMQIKGWSCTILLIDSEKWEIYFGYGGLDGIHYVPRYLDGLNATPSGLVVLRLGTS